MERRDFISSIGSTLAWPIATRAQYYAILVIAMLSVFFFLNDTAPTESSPLPLHAALPFPPPVFLAHGGDDIISPPENSVLMYLALKRAGIPAELHIYANTTHDFGVRTNDHSCSTWTGSDRKSTRLNSSHSQISYAVFCLKK